MEWVYPSVCCAGVYLPKKYLDNLILFVDKFELLMRRKHTQQSIELMKEKWRDFVLEFAELYVN